MVALAEDTCWLVPRHARKYCNRPVVLVVVVGEDVAVAAADDTWELVVLVDYIEEEERAVERSWCLFTVLGSLQRFSPTDLLGNRRRRVCSQKYRR